MEREKEAYDERGVNGTGSFKKVSKMLRDFPRASFIEI
jgi:hypothetical protein